MCIHYTVMILSLFCSRDLDLDPIYEFDIDILKINLHTKNEASRSRLSKVRAQTAHRDSHIDMQMTLSRDQDHRITKCQTSVIHIHVWSAFNRKAILLLLLLLFIR